MAYSRKGKAMFAVENDDKRRRYLAFSKSSCWEWGLGNHCKTADIMATTIAKSIKLNSICNPGVLCLPPTFVKLC